MFSQWVISIVGIVLLSVLADIILPQGQTNKYIKSIFAILTVFVIVSPLPTLFNGFSNQEDLFLDQETVAVDDNYLNQLVVLKQNEQESLIEQILTENGYLDIKPKVTISFNDGNYKIELIEVYLKNAVIHNEDKNINIKEMLRELIVNVCCISQEKVVFYE